MKKNNSKFHGFGVRWLPNVHVGGMSYVQALEKVLKTTKKGCFCYYWPLLIYKCYVCFVFVLSQHSKFEYCRRSVGDLASFLEVEKKIRR